MPLQAAALRYVADPTPQHEARVCAILEPELWLICRSILRNPPTPDQLQDARIAVMLALRDYDPKRAKFTTIVPLYIRRSLYRNNQGMIPIPEYQRNLLGKLAALSARWMQEQGRPPEDEEIAEAFRLTLDQVQGLRQAGSAIAGSLAADAEAETAGLECATAARTNALKSGCGESGRAWSSGWNWVPRKNG